MEEDTVVTVFCGIDWAERHHDIALVDGDGTLIAKRRIPDDPDGFDVLTAMLAAAGDTAEDPAEEGHPRYAARIVQVSPRSSGDRASVS